MDLSEDDYKALISEDAGHVAFVAYADLLRSTGRWPEAVEVCLAGLTANPANHKGRLVLARLYYDRGYIPFAVRELEILTRALPQNEPVRKLLERLTGAPVAVNGEAPPVKDDTIAEAEFDLGEIDLIEKDR
jgi:hypothetical protein